MTATEMGWMKEVRQSRLVVLPEEASYLQGIDLPVVDLLEELAGGVTLDELMQQYPCLTEADIRACSLFFYLRVIGRI